MLNFRKLRQDYSPSTLKEGKGLFDKGSVLDGKIITLTHHSVRLVGRVQGGFEHTHKCEIEIDRGQSTTIDSRCDCSAKYDCNHLSAVLFFLEEKFDEILVNYSKETNLDQVTDLDAKGKASLRATLKQAERKTVVRQEKKQQKEVLDEYVGAATILAKSPYFVPEETLVPDQAEIALMVSRPASSDPQALVEVQLIARLPFRSKPIIIPQIRDFLEGVRHGEPMYIAGQRYYFTLEKSFDRLGIEFLRALSDMATFPEVREERQFRLAYIQATTLGTLLAKAYELLVARTQEGAAFADAVPRFYCGGLEEPLQLSLTPAMIRVALENLEIPSSKLLLNPMLLLDQSNPVILEEAWLFSCATPGLIHNNTYYPFAPEIKHKHLKGLTALREITIPEPLFGTFVENSLPELLRFADVTNREAIEKFVTLPFVGTLKAECELQYLNGELEATLHFVYDKMKVPAALSQLTLEQILPFVTKQGCLARNLTEEQKLVERLFQGFSFDPATGIFSTKSDKVIIDFMTSIIPQQQQRVTFHCPENLLEQFLYDESQFELHLRETKRIDVYEVELKVKGSLNGVRLDALWDCIASKQAFIELAKTQTKSSKKRGGDNNAKKQKILVLNLERLAPIVNLFDEIGMHELTDHVEERPLWSLASLDAEQIATLPLEFSMTPRLREIQKQMLGMTELETVAVPKSIKATLRNYQQDGINWLGRLSRMHLNGVLADDMGLGKSLQSIITLTNYHESHPKACSLIVCPTSLIYNWKEEIAKFHPKFKVLPGDGTPAQRKKLLNDIKDYDIIITSYSLLQKDIEFYKTVPFGYVILDEAQHIKNRTTRNAKSVKMLQASHRLILTGTPIENSLDELWSLFDFLMPGLLGSFERFVEKYLRNPQFPTGRNIEGLRKKVSPFILRRMKKDVLTDLPPVNQIVYHSHLSDTQRALYNSYAASAREELSQLVKKEGFDKVQIHVLATLTRLKQICCHPAIFAKEKAEPGDSAKYEMLMELLQTLIEGKHKTVIFSQYTRMLNIIRQDLQKQRIKFEYLDGTSKNRLEIVNSFNNDPSIPVFLVSLKAGGAGLNLVGADTVIHYDMWWNPAVEDQATGRVHRIGQKSELVSSYKLVSLNTVEEKIIQLQQSKSSLVTQVVTSDEEAIGKLTWEEVLELLQT